MLQRWLAFALAVALATLVSLAQVLGATSPAAAHAHGDFTSVYDEASDLASTSPLAPTVADSTIEGRVERSFRGGVTATDGIGSAAETTLRSTGGRMSSSVVFPKDRTLGYRIPAANRAKAKPSGTG
jgi:hypothetical protein